MITSFTQNLGASATVITATGLASLASSATAGYQLAPVTLIDGNNNVPEAIDIDIGIKLGSGTLGSDKAVYLFLARSADGTNFESGPPTVGASAAAYTFANSPVGTSPLPTDLYPLPPITFNASAEARRKLFRIFAPPPKFVIVVLNYTGIALSATGTDFTVQYRTRIGDGR